MFQKTAQEQVLVTNALPVTARKASLNPSESRNSHFFRTADSPSKNPPKLVGRLAPETLSEIQTLSGHLGQKATINPRHKERPPDIENPKERYNATYVPPGGVNLVQPLTSMKYNLATQQLKLQGEFRKRLKDAILENSEASKALHITKYYCSGCDGFLFSENDILNHVPVYTSDYNTHQL